MLAIDHLVFVSHHPEQDAMAFAEKHDVTVVEGGKHENWGTYNYLAFFQNNSYIEWLGVFNEQLAKESNNPLVQLAYTELQENHTGLISFALRTVMMDQYLQHFNENDINYVGPEPGSRKRLDGSTLAWRMLFPTDEVQLPFLIEWGKDMNRPQNKEEINKRILRTIKVPDSPKIYQKIFQLQLEDNQIELENGRLLFTNGSQPEFELGD